MARLVMTEDDRWTLINACHTAKVEYEKLSEQCLQKKYRLGRNAGPHEARNFDRLARQFQLQAEDMKKWIIRLENAE